MGQRTRLTAKDPFDLFGNWLREAAATEPEDFDAAQLATVDEKGMPNIRTVLVRAWSREGFVFYTNYRSAKGKELLATRRGALLFYWKSAARQIRIRGTVFPVDDAVADAYFASRPRGSQLAAHASRQSETLPDRNVLKDRLKMCRERFSGIAVPRPFYWSGFRLAPVSIEFWQKRPFRLHERLQFRLRGTLWKPRLLYP